MKVASLKFTAKKEPPFHRVELDEDGNIRYYDRKGELHRLDGPAVEYINGTKEWRIHGRLHRLDGPAIEEADGTKYWHINGMGHRLNGPAVEYPNGYKEWWVEGARLGDTEEEFTPGKFEYWKRKNGYVRRRRKR